MVELTPYQRGFDDAVSGRPAPPFPTPDSSWSQRLYERGWRAGVDAHKQPSSGHREGS